MNDNTSVTITDVATFSAVFGKTSGSPGYSARHDLNGNNAITITDVAQFAPVFGTSCTP